MNALEMMKQELTREQAIALADTEWWKEIDLAEAARLQLRQDRLCMLFSDFQAGIEKLLGRPVWTHEFAGAKGRESLIAEIEGKRLPPRSPFESLAEAIGPDRAAEAVVVVTEA